MTWLCLEQSVPPLSAVSVISMHLGGSFAFSCSERVVDTYIVIVNGTVIILEFSEGFGQ